MEPVLDRRDRDAEAERRGRALPERSARIAIGLQNLGVQQRVHLGAREGGSHNAAIEDRCRVGAYDANVGAGTSDHTAKRRRRVLHTRNAQRRPESRLRG